MSDFTPTDFKIVAFTDGQTYSSPSVLNVWSACETFFGVKFCVSIKVHINGVQMCLSVAGYERCFGIGGNGCFDFELGVARVGVCISDFSYSNVNSRPMCTTCDRLVCTTHVHRNWTTRSPRGGSAARCGGFD